MRIKINDKIYRLKEIESGVDSLMELVEEPKHKHGDFLVSKGGHPFILDREGLNGESHYLFAISIYDPDVKSIQDSGGKLYCGYLKDASVADQETIKKIHDGLKSIGKCWNDDKKCVEDIPVSRFKKGDKVRIKDGISSKTVSGITPAFNQMMDDFIGTTMTVNRYTDMCGYVVCEESGWRFHEDWLEPYEELRKGDLAIFWDDNKDCALIRIYNRKGYSHHSDSYGHLWENAIKFESKEQFKRFIKGKL